ncbi:efflux RND transporter periplasmic adaptor subunit [Undibacterium terreum]|uniref:Hemolysin D n=1 Tax=Undibacterium terreum TaxID=1224302 RepID=A0A916U4M5_9BURK|nr:efflux RND transporter periplasmic adaptor subunit [Undibacterium terreum]GGC57371.1 hemolysin D [Undibacterium terreum]
MSALAAVVLAGCDSRGQEAPKAQIPEVTVLTARHASVPVVQDLPGRTSAYLVAQVRARVDGIVQKRSFQEGAEVKANQQLYQIDPAPYRAALASAEAAQLKAQANLSTTSAQADRYKLLVAGNAVSKQAFDNAIAAQQEALADVAAAAAAVTSAKINLGYTSVTSPITGRSGISQVTQGGYVQGSSATLLTTIQQLDPIYVDLSQPSIAGLQLRRDVADGQLKLDGADKVKLWLTLEDGTRYPLPGTLQTSTTTVDPSTGSLTVRAVFPNPQYVLLPGMFVHARMEQGINDAAFLIPISAVTHNAKGEATVLVVNTEQKLAERVIQASGTVGNNWVVNSGIQEGERIVLAGAQRIQPGTLVRSVPSQNIATAAPTEGKKLPPPEIAMNAETK